MHPYIERPQPQPAYLLTRSDTLGSDNEDAVIYLTKEMGSLIHLPKNLFVNVLHLSNKTKEKIEVRGCGNVNACTILPKEVQAFYGYGTNWRK